MIERSDLREYSETDGSYDLLSALNTEDENVESGPSFCVDLEGYEGPLDLLLDLARSQKVDLTRISILALVEQYLKFVDEARRMHLEVAADYLVMAAWLAYLKSRLLLPEQKEEDEPSGEELAAALAFRLRRLEAMRNASDRLMARNREGRDVLHRGAPETMSEEHTSIWEASIFDLLSAYATQRQRQSVTTVRFAKRKVWSLQEARDLLVKLIGEAGDWTPINTFLQEYLLDDRDWATMVASTFSASLELVREGNLEIRQGEAFTPLYIRSLPKEQESRV